MTLTELKKNFKENIEEVRKTYPTYADTFLFRVLAEMYDYFKSPNTLPEETNEEMLKEFANIVKDYEESKEI